MPLLTAGLALLCAWLLIRLLATVGDAFSTTPDLQASLARSEAAWTAAQTESLARWHLFGHVLPGIDARSAVDAPDTGLDLLLVGTLADRDPAAGIAIIAGADGHQSAYRADAQLPGGARLRAIHEDHVILLHNGRDERLRLPREYAHQRPGAEQGAALAPGTSSGPGASSASASPAISSVAVAGLEAVDWTAVQRQMQVDPTELARQIRILPVFEQGQMVGVRLSGGANTPLLTRLGLRPDDVVTAINGVTVLDTGRAHQVLSTVANAERASVTVRRDGREETLNVSLR